ncbi:MAG: GNAT family N-acetyltransferase [Bacteroidota bacterium]
MNLQITNVRTPQIEELQNWYDQFTPQEKSDLEFHWEDRFYVARKMGVTLGILSTAPSGSSYWIQIASYVHPRFRSRNISTLLLRNLEMEARKGNVKYLGTSVKATNKKGIQYLKNQGFYLSQSVPTAHAIPVLMFEKKL